MQCTSGYPPAFEELNLRVIETYRQEFPDIVAGKSVIITAHGNSIRALLKYLENIPENEIVELNIPTAVPLVYELTDDMKPIRRYYLGNQDEINAKMAAVAAQGKAKA